MTSALAAVNLTFSDRDATPTARTVPQGTTFPLAVLLASTTTSTADKAAGVDYYIHASSSNVFTIASRNTTTDGSSFTDTIQNDSAVANIGINPTTGDLGGSVPNQAIPVSNGTFTVADYVISVNPAAATGGYTLSFDSGSTYSQPGTSFNDVNFTTLGSFSVTVTAAPEPTVALPLVAMTLVFCRRRGRTN
ncbi:MAG TPA: hypothetical protein VH370_22475 [Humisphaera sp.]|jgi:hypothetical protein|nr:hypothetical protein [Humisphaera sp.]